MRLSNTLLAHSPLETKIKVPSTFFVGNETTFHVQWKPPKVNVTGIMVIVCNIQTCLKPITAFVLSIICRARREGRLSGYLKLGQDSTNARDIAFMECPKEISIISSSNELKLDLWGRARRIWRVLRSYWGVVKG
jgi:hypothetical protein